MSTRSRKIEIFENVVEMYLKSGDFNGMGVSALADGDVTAVCDLIKEKKVDLVRGDGHPNPHIKAFPADPISEQVKKVELNGLEGCLYPTPEALLEMHAGANEPAPYTKALMEGSPQLTHRAFDLRALEWYRNDPRFEFKIDDIHGRIVQKSGTEIGGRKIVRDGLEFFEFGFAYNDEMDRAVAAFVRYLHDLPVEQQVDMKRHELTGEFKLHPDFFRTQIMGHFPIGISIYDAFLQEKREINVICKLLGRPNLFRTQVNDEQRPNGFGILIRPTRKEFREFALLLDQLLSDDIDKDFFGNDIETKRRLIDDEGREEVHAKGTISLLEEWMSRFYSPDNPTKFKEFFKDFRAVRKARQKPAHLIEDDHFDQEYLSRQRELMSKAYGVVQTIRIVLANHPQAREYEYPEYMQKAKIWLM